MSNLELMVAAMPYIIIILMVTLATFFAEKARKRWPLVFLFMSIVIVVLPAIFAGIRANTVGIDIMVYEKWCFQHCVASESIWEVFQSVELEKSFVLINYIASCFSNDIGVALFMIELVFLTFIYMTAYRCRNVMPMWLFIFAAYCGLYNLSFNLMRQCLAMACMCFAFSYLFVDRSVRKFVFFSIFAILFHKTAILMVAVLLVIEYISTRENDSLRLKLAIAFVMSCLVGVLLFKVVLSSIPIFSHYLAYATNASWQPIVIKPLVLADIISIILSYGSYKYGIIDKRVSYSYALTAIVDMSGQFLGAYTLFASRIGMYTCSLQAFYLLYIFSSSHITVRTRVVLMTMFFVAYTSMWCYFVKDTGRTVPYKTSLESIF